MKLNRSSSFEIVAQLVIKFPAFYGILMFITMFTEPSTGPYPEPDESNPQHSTLSLKDTL